MARRRTRRNTPRRTTATSPAAARALLDSEADAAARRLAGQSPARRTSGGASGLARSLPIPGYAMLSIANSATYRERAFTAGVGPRDTWGDYADRCLRYDVYWAHYEGTIYRKLHEWATTLKVDHGLYEHIRSILSPAYRIVEFWAAHIYGGGQDGWAGASGPRPRDPSTVDAAPLMGVPGLTGVIPIVAAPALARVVAQILADSGWAAHKDIYPRFGAALGDVALIVKDNELAGKVTIDIVHPRTLYDLRKDAAGNVKGYTIVESRADPRETPAAALGIAPRHVIYAEVAERLGDSVQYTTYLDGEPYDWRRDADDIPGGYPADGGEPTWTEEYTFIPLVHVQNRNMGLGWGWGELQGSSGKLFELDDLASKVDDQVRIAVDPEWYIAGAAPGDVGAADDEAAGEEEGPGRGDKKLVFGPEGSSAQAMLAPLVIADVTAHIKYLEDAIAKDHPELTADDVGLAASAEARRVAREKVEAQVVQRRAAYDDGLVRAVQMAISIGAAKGYDGFQDFDEESYARGELAWSVGGRPVFAVSEDDRLARAVVRSTAIKTFVDAGMGLRSAMKLAGVEEADVEEAVAERDEAERKAAEADQAMMAEVAARDAQVTQSSLGGPDAGADRPPIEEQR